MAILPQKHIDDMYKVLIDGYKLTDIDEDLYSDDDDELEIIDPSYINRVGVEYGEKVIYWEENYDPSYYRMGENDGDEEKAIINYLYECGLDFDTDLVAKYPKDYIDND